jgi:hypothetical protein
MQVSAVSPVLEVDSVAACGKPSSPRGYTVVIPTDACLCVSGFVLHRSSALAVGADSWLLCTVKRDHEWDSEGRRAWVSHQDVVE